jgi:hypothetical protein
MKTIVGGNYKSLRSVSQPCACTPTPQGLAAFLIRAAVGKALQASKTEGINGLTRKIRENACPITAIERVFLNCRKNEFLKSPLHAASFSKFV